jgi:hypothetical protein
MSFYYRTKGIRNKHGLLYITYNESDSLTMKYTADDVSQFVLDWPSISKNMLVHHGSAPSPGAFFGLFDQCKFTVTDKTLYIHGDNGVYFRQTLDD